MSLTFTLTGTESVLSSKYYPPIILDDSNYVVGLINMETFNSFPNIDSSNNKFYFISPVSNQLAVIEIPEGSYEIDDINAYLNKALRNYVLNETKQIENKNVKKKRKILPPTLIISGNNNTLKCMIKSTLDIDFSQPNSVGSLLGFKPGKLKANITHISDLTSKISKINAIAVECNIASGTFRNNKQVHIIHEFFPTVPPGFKIVETPTNVIYLPINTKEINEIILKITDQDGNLVNFRGEVVTVRLHVKKLT